MKPKQFEFTLNQIAVELSALLTASDGKQQDKVTDVIAEVFADENLDIAEAFNELIETPTVEVENRDEVIADKNEEFYKEVYKNER